jgi:DNA-binding FrmR family transcriptional regulator
MYECKVENKKLINRINRISGQVNSLKGKLTAQLECEESQDPYEIIRQLSAIKGAVNGMMNSYIEHYAKGHLVDSIKDAKTKEDAMASMDNLLDIMKSFSK